MTTLVHHKWLSHLLGYDYTIIYKRGVDNIIADSLSQTFEGMSACSAILLVQPVWLKELTQSWEGNTHKQYLIAKLLLSLDCIIFRKFEVPYLAGVVSNRYEGIFWGQKPLYTIFPLYFTRLLLL